MASIYQALQRARRESRAGSQPLSDLPPTEGQAAVPVAIPRAKSGHIGDAMTALLGAVRPLLDSKPAAVLHMVAATAGEGTSTLAREFALLLATTGHRQTLLLDANHLNSKNAALFGCGASVDLAESLANHTELENGFRRVEDSLLTVGSLSPDKRRVHADVANLRRLYEQLRQRFETTIVDCPPIESGLYADLLPEAADGILLVIQAEKARPAVVAHAKELVEHAGGNFIGAILNRRKNYIPGFLYRNM